MISTIVGMVAIPSLIMLSIKLFYDHVDKELSIQTKKLLPSHIKIKLSDLMMP